MDDAPGEGGEVGEEGAATGADDTDGAAGGGAGADGVSARLERPPETGVKKASIGSDHATLLKSTPLGSFDAPVKDTKDVARTTSVVPKRMPGAK